MNRNSLILIVLGVIALAAGAVMQFTGGPPKADAALVERCRAEMATRGADAAMTAKCDETAFATAMTATDADAAARSISAANGSEIGGNMISMFLIGLGLVLLLGGVIARHKRG
jgi:hypothetical protein